MSCRILHVIPALAGRYGGPSAAVVGMGRALLAAHTTPVVATTDADGPGRLPVELGVVRPHLGVPTIFFARRASESFKWSSQLAAWLQSHVEEFDVVHIHAVFSHSSLAAGRACRSAGVPYIVRPLGTLDPWSLSRHPGRKRLLFALGVRRLLTHAAMVHYTSHEEQRLAEQRLPWLARGVVIPLGIDEELFDRPSVESSSAAPTIVTMSRLHEKKGVDLLIGAFHDLAAAGAHHEWRLLIAGDGEPGYVEQLKRIAANGPARERVDFLGWLDGSQRLQVLRQAKLFALASHQENFGIAAIEAMACGVAPLLSPGVNLSAEIARAGAGWVADRTAEAWCKALGVALSDPMELARRGAKAREFAAQFRWPAIANELTMLYRTLSAARRTAVT